MSNRPIKRLTTKLEKNVRNEAVSPELQKRYTKIHKIILASQYGDLQRSIDDGSVWTKEGSAGREAMQALEKGFCICADKFHRDYYGNIVPAWFVLDDKSKGSLGNAERVYREKPNKRSK